MRTGSAGRQILHTDRTHFIHLFRMPPDINEALLANISGGVGKLHTRENFAVRRDVAGGVTGTARCRVKLILSGRSRYGAELIDIADKRRIPENLAQFALIHREA